MTAIEWERLDPNRTEDLVSSLLNHVFPNRAQRIDGSGGDGGRDVQLTLDDGIHVFEIKSFTGRMGRNRRKHVEASLKRAATLNPKSWTLLVPIDPNPTELEWFGRLESSVPFPIHWRGRTWLDTELAARPYLVRYWVEGTAEEVKRLLELARQEEAGLVAGAVDAVARVQRVMGLLNEGDPYYRYEIRTDGETSSILPIPRYRGADRDRPITFRFVFAFPNTDEARAIADKLKASIDYGTPVHIPGEYIRESEVDAPIPLLPKGGARSLDISPSPRTRRPVDLVVAVVDPKGAPLGEIPIAAAVTSSGERGAKIAGHDRTGLVTVDMTLDVPDRRANATISVTHPTSPFYADEMLASVRVLKHAVEPNFLEFRIADGGSISRGPSPFGESLVEPGFDEFLDDVLLVQWASRVTRRVGPTFPREDVIEVEVAARLLRGETVEGTWTDFRTTLREDASDDARQRLARVPFAMAIVTHEPHAAKVGGVEYRIGRGVEHHFESVTLAPGQGDVGPDGLPVGVPLRFVPGDSNRMSRRLVTEDRPSVYPDVGGDKGAPD